MRHQDFGLRKNNDQMLFEKPLRFKRIKEYIFLLAIVAKCYLITVFPPKLLFFGGWGATSIQRKKVLFSCFLSVM